MPPGGISTRAAVLWSRGGGNSSLISIRIESRPPSPVGFAREVGERRLYLYTDTAEGWYRRCGWRTLARVDCHGTQQAILVLGL